MSEYKRSRVVKDMCFTTRKKKRWKWLSFFICSSSARCNSYLPPLYHFIIRQLFEERSNYLQHGKCNLNKKHMREKTINVCKQPKKIHRTIKITKKIRTNKSVHKK